MVNQKIATFGLMKPFDLIIVGAGAAKIFSYGK